MEFIPNENELKLISTISKYNRNSYTLIRFTKTMLSKSIIDANASFRDLLYRNINFDYYTDLKSGEKNFIDYTILFQNKIENKVSIYRPNTKKGDPRFWLYGISKYVQVDDMIYITFSNEKLYIIPLTEKLFNLSLIKSTLNSKSLATPYIEIIKKISNKPILSVSPHKFNSKDAGDTLELACGIKTNSNKGADFNGEVELKSKVSKFKTSDTLFCMVPSWTNSPVKSSTDIILNYGYHSRKYPEFIDLYVTVSSIPNNQGLYLELDEETKLLWQKHKDKSDTIRNVCCWKFEDLEKRLYEKHPETLWVKASKEIIDSKIYFRYESIKHTQKPIFQSFLLLIQNGGITFDWRGRVKPNRKNYKDKGHGFRLKSGYSNVLFSESDIIL